MPNNRAYAPCTKCGAINHGTSKHRPVKVEGGAFCGHCGSTLSLPGDKPQGEQSQALATMAEAFKAAQFKGDTIKGTISDGGAIWLAAQALYPDSVWEAAIAQVTFKDGSAIEFERVPGSTFATIYRAVGPLPVAQVEPITRWDKFPGKSTHRYTVRKFEREWVGNYRREQWVIYMASDNESIAHAWYIAEQARTGGYYQLADESVSPMKVLSITCG